MTTADTGYEECKRLAQEPAEEPAEEPDDPPGHMQQEPQSPPYPVSPRQQEPHSPPYAPSPREPQSPPYAPSPREPQIDGDGGRYSGPATRMCRYFNQAAGCRLGDSCRFAHVTKHCAFFLSEAGCRSESCRFKHDPTGATTAVVRACPTRGCPNMCVGPRCRDCYQQQHSPPRRRRSTPYRRARRQSPSPPRRRPDYRDRPVRQCPERGCRNTCRGKCCKECHFRRLAANPARSPSRQTRALD